MDLVQAVTKEYSSAEYHKTIVDALDKTYYQLTSVWAFIQLIKPRDAPPTASDPYIDLTIFYVDLRAYLHSHSTAQMDCQQQVLTKIEHILADVHENISTCESHRNPQQAFECFADLRFHVIDGIEIVEDQRKKLHCPANGDAEHLLNNFRQCNALHPIKFITALKHFARQEITRIPVGRKVSDAAPVSLSALQTLPSLVVPTEHTPDYAQFYKNLKGAEADFMDDGCTQRIIAKAATILREYQRQAKVCKAIECLAENVFVYEIRELLIGIIKFERTKCVVVSASTPTAADETAASSPSHPVSNQVENNADKFEKVRMLIFAFIHHRIDDLVAGLKHYAGAN